MVVRLVTIMREGLNVIGDCILVSADHVGQVTTTERSFI